MAIIIIIVIIIIGSILLLYEFFFFIRPINGNQRYFKQYVNDQVGNPRCQACSSKPIICSNQRFAV